MIQDSIRWFFNFLCSFYLFYKLLNLKNPKILQKISFFIIFLIDSFLFCFLEANSFIYGADIDSYPVTVFQEQIENGETKVELMGRLTEEQFSALKDCLKGSKMTKRRFKRML